MDLSLLILSFAVVCLPVCQSRAVTHRKDLPGDEKDDNESSYISKKPSADDYNTKTVDWIGRGNIF